MFGLVRKKNANRIWATMQSAINDIERRLKATEAEVDGHHAQIIDLQNQAKCSHKGLHKIAAKTGYAFMLSWPTVQPSPSCASCGAELDETEGEMHEHNAKYHKECADALKPKEEEGENSQ